MSLSAFLYNPVAAEGSPVQGELVPKVTEGLFGQDCNNPSVIFLRK